MKYLFKLIKTLILIILLLVVVVAIFDVSPFTFSKVKGTNEFRRNTNTPLIVPHGGAKQLAPENTIYSFEMLDELGVDVLEIDLSFTYDKVLISHHDLDLEMSDDHEYNNELIRLLTYEEIVKAYDNDDYYLARNFVDVDGNKPFEDSSKDDLKKMVPARLKEDIFEKYKDKNYLYMLEIKDAPTAKGYDSNIHDYKLATEALIDLIVLYGLEKRVVIGSFEDLVINYIKEINEDIIVGAATSEATKFSIFSALSIDFFWGVKSDVMILPNPESMKIPGSLTGVVSKLPKFIKKNIAIDDNGTLRANLMGKQLINDAHRKNIAVFYWTVNDIDEMKLLIRNGADGIITDRPDLLIKVINDMRDGR